MRYIGRKHRIAKKLAEAILPHTKGRVLIEPFCGGMSATVALQPAAASDASKPLIDLILAVRVGWEPPTEVSEEAYKLSRTKELSECNVTDAFHLICCSFGGKWKGGLARGGKSEPNRNFALEGRNVLVRKVKATLNVDFRCVSYNEYKTQAGQVFYCDPPYEGVTNGYATGPFDSAAFWNWARQGADNGALIFVSEFTAPDWAEVHAEFPSKTDLGKKSGDQTTVEKLYRIGDLL